MTATVREKKFRAVCIKLGVFAACMILVTVMLVAVFSQFRGGSSNSYSAIFTSASGMNSGSKVRIAGVEVGRVDSVEVTRTKEAKVTFDVDTAFPLPTSVKALVRYENLTGDRYLELQQGTGDPNSYLGKGDTIPVSNTEPALDLDKLLGGFKPLLSALNPKQVNELSNNLVQVFQGQGPALSELLANTATFTNALADRDELIGSVIDNLNGVMGTLNDGRNGLDQSLTRLQQLVSGLAAQRNTIGESLTNTARLTNNLTDVLSQNRGSFAAINRNTEKLSDNLLRSEGYLRGLIQRFPDSYLKLSQLSSYGAWIQLYLCQMRFKFNGPGGNDIVTTLVDLNKPGAQSPGGRCQV